MDEEMRAADELGAEELDGEEKVPGLDDEEAEDEEDLDLDEGEAEAEV